MQARISSFTACYITCSVIFKDCLVHNLNFSASGSMLSSSAKRTRSWQAEHQTETNTNQYIRSLCRHVLIDTVFCISHFLDNLCLYLPVVDGRYAPVPKKNNRGHRGTRVLHLAYLIHHFDARTNASTNLLVFGCILK